MIANTYLAYGLRIETEIDCPELPSHPLPSGKADVVIRLSPPGNRSSEPLANGYYEVHPGVFRMSVRDVGHYLVEDGARITVEPVEGVPEETLRLYLMGSAMGALLYQRGLFPLHGSAVETPWGAMIFLGEQGAGKSTLASRFHRRGYRLLSDDVCAVTKTPAGLMVLPALAQVRLCADAYERLGTPPGARFDVDKFVVPMGEGYCPDPVRLRGIHILCEHDKPDPEFEVLRGLDRVQRLLENLYRPEYLEGQRPQRDLMALAGFIAKECTAAMVSRRRDAQAIDGLVDFLELEWAKHFSRPS